MIVPPIWNSSLIGHDDSLNRSPTSYKVGACLITQDNRGLQLLFHVAGVMTNDLQVEVIDEVLTVSGHVIDRETNDMVSSFKRSLELDTRAFDDSQMEAKVLPVQGVLVVTVPTRKQQAPKQTRERNFMFWYNQDKEKETPVHPPQETIEVTLVQPQEIVDASRQPAHDRFDADNDVRDDELVGMVVSF